MKLSSALILSAVLLVSGSFAYAGTWTCKTGPIWNGRARYPRFLTGSTKDEAYNKATNACRYSGQENICVSAISCWES